MSTKKSSNLVWEHFTVNKSTKQLNLTTLKNYLY